ncbi:MAG: hypothetical protein MRK01_16220 [Candidatus Scalindua sp.]|nr:hypothetical protein [Candidatus Scalindua sp.]
MKSIFFLSLILIMPCRTSFVMANEAPTTDELISYLEAKIPLETGMETHFSARILDKEMEGTKQEKYKVKILNKDLMIIEKENSKIAKSSRDNPSFATAQTNYTEVIKLENLSPEISLIYKLSPTVGDEAVNAIYPPHIKIKISAKPAKKWKRYNNDIEQVIAMLNETKEKETMPFSERDSYLLLTIDEKAAKNIGKALSHLILLCQQERNKDQS